MLVAFHGEGYTLSPLQEVLIFVIYRILLIDFGNENGRLKFERILQVALSFPRTCHSVGSYVVCCI